jgi:cell wall assembly regulator SMI1
MIEVSRIRELLNKVPKPPEDLLPQGVSDEDCDDFEKRTGITLPHDMRDWLKMANGPCVGPGGLFGIRPLRKHLDIESLLSLFPLWKTRKWIPIAGDGCGNYYVIPTQYDYGNGYPILFVEASSCADFPSYIVSSDVGHFLVFLLEKELGKQGWPFNERFVTELDPRIVHFKGVELPWTAQ